nr:MAG: hypothetical protein [Molluscum contagiosum virus]
MIATHACSQSLSVLCSARGSGIVTPPQLLAAAPAQGD